MIADATIATMVCALWLATPVWTMSTMSLELSSSIGSSAGVSSAGVFSFSDGFSSATASDERSMVVTAFD